jgi:hypothetical protein
MDNVNVISCTGRGFRRQISESVHRSYTEAASVSMQKLLQKLQDLVDIQCNQINLPRIRRGTAKYLA